MTRSELLVAVAAAHPELTGREVDAAIEVLFREMAAAVRRGDRVELRRFGVLAAVPSSRTRSGRRIWFKASVVLASKIAGGG